MLKVVVYPGDRWGCGHYRLIWPAHAVALRSSGLDINVELEVTVVPSNQREVGGRTRSGQLISENFPRDVDVVVLQRPTHRWLVQAIPMLRARGVAVVVDMDDDLSRIHPRNPAFAGYAPVNEPVTLTSFRHAIQACHDATLVTVSTPRLAEVYASHGRVRLLPNCVPERYLSIEHTDSNVIGWAGSLHSHPDDLSAIGGGVAALVNQGDSEFRVVGNPEGVGRALGLRRAVDGTGPVAFEDWAENVTGLGIGIAPLADTLFNQSKSWLKALEYSAVGVPWVASPSPDYQALHAEGAGLIADRPRNWELLLRRLHSDAGLRADLSAAGRDVAARWTVEHNAWRWAEAWASAVELQRGPRAERAVFA